MPIQATPLSPLERRLIRASFGKIARKEYEVTQVFFHKLKEINPSLSKKFKCQPRPQNSSLIESLALIITSIESPEMLSKHINALKHKLTALNIAHHDYPQLALIFLFAIENILQQHFSPKVKKAWQSLITFALLEESPPTRNELDAGAM